MSASLTPLTELPAWKALSAHAAALQSTHLRDLFAQDPARGTRLHATAGDLYLDYSKHRITDETLAIFAQLAEQSNLRASTEAMFTGQKINITEGRAVLHTALRAPADSVVLVVGENVIPGVHAVLTAFSVQQREKFRVAGVASVDSVQVDGRLASVDGRFAPVLVWARGNGRGHLFGLIPVSVGRELSYGDFRRVKPFRERFGVQIGEIKALDF